MCINFIVIVTRTQHPDFIADRHQKLEFILGKWNLLKWKEK